MCEEVKSTWGAIIEASDKWNFDTAPWVYSDALPEPQQMLARSLEGIVEKFVTWENTAHACMTAFGGREEYQVKMKTHLKDLADLDKVLKEACRIQALSTLVGNLLSSTCTEKNRPKPQVR